MQDLAVPHSIHRNKSPGSPESRGQEIDSASWWEELHGLSSKDLDAGKSWVGPGMPSIHHSI